MGTLNFLIIILSCCSFLNLSQAYFDSSVILWWILILYRQCNISWSLYLDGIIITFKFWQRFTFELINKVLYLYNFCDELLQIILSDPIFFESNFLICMVPLSVVHACFLIWKIFKRLFGSFISIPFKRSTKRASSIS